MRTKPAAALCAAIATTVIALGATTPAARNFSTTNQNFRITFTDLEVEALFFRNDCHLTLEGSLHTRTMAKVTGTLIGYVTRAIAGQCTVATRPLAETLPWHVRYESFSGRLPDITLVITTIRVAIEMPCLVDTNVKTRVSRAPSTGQLIAIEVPSQTVPLTGVFCPETGTVRSVGSGQIALSVTNRRISLTLI